MKPEPLYGIFAKIDRTKTQIHDLDERLTAFFRTNPYRVSSYVNEDGTKEIWHFILDQIPVEIPLVIGEILHNLRSPLDQILCVVALKFGLPEEGVAFPRGRTENELKVVLGKQEKRLPQDALDIISAAKPYKNGGNVLLWALLELNRRDKHRVGLVPVNFPSATSASYIVFWRGLPLIIGCRTGQHLVNERKSFDPTELEETGQPLALYDARPGRIFFGDASSRGDESLEFLTTTPGAKFEADFQPSLNVAFSGVGLDGQPVLAVLNDMRRLVEDILLTFEGRFFPANLT